MVARSNAGVTVEFESKTRSAGRPVPRYLAFVAPKRSVKESSRARAGVRSEASAVVADPRYAAILDRDQGADGTFFYSVKTTGVFCRPSCPSRRARPENIDFHTSAAAAEREGFRPCKRCRPDEAPRANRHASIVAGLCRVLERSEEPPTLGDLAKHAGWSAFHTHRTFRAIAGVTPKAYAAAHRAKRVRAELQKGGSVTDAIYGAGYGSNGRFYAKSHEMLGMTPTAYRAGGKNTEIRFALGECSLGSILVAATARGVCAILLGSDPEELVHDLERRFPRAALLGGDRAFERVMASVIGLVEEPRVRFDLPLDIRGTAFQCRVWEALRKIPAGATASYAQIAASIGAPLAVRAVGRACGANALAVAIPCHRVVRTDGSLSGYRWGVERKRALREREEAAAEKTR